jgi:hypothetical protein
VSSGSIRQRASEAKKLSSLIDQRDSNHVSDEKKPKVSVGKAANHDVNSVAKPGLRRKKTKQELIEFVYGKRRDVTRKNILKNVSITMNHNTDNDQTGINPGEVRKEVIGHSTDERDQVLVKPYDGSHKKPARGTAGSFVDFTGDRSIMKYTPGTGESVHSKPSLANKTRDSVMNASMRKHTEVGKSDKTAGIQHQGNYCQKTSQLKKHPNQTVIKQSDVVSLSVIDKDRTCPRSTVNSKSRGNPDEMMKAKVCMELSHQERKHLRQQLTYKQVPEPFVPNNNTLKPGQQVRRQLEKNAKCAVKAASR